MEHGGREVLSYPLPSPAALAPPDEWDRLRRECPVAHIKFPSGDSGTLLTRYDNVKQILSDTRFTRALDAPDAARISDSETGGLFNSAMSNVLPQSGEAHLHWRRQLNKWFTVRRMNEMRTKVEAMAESLVDDMVAKGSPADLKSSFGFPLPVWVICDMLGVPDTDRTRFASWSDMILNLDRFSQDEVGAAMGEFFAYIADHIAAKRTEPGEDILSALIAGTDLDGAPMSDMVLAATGIGLLVAGHETTANMIGKMVAMLLADREKRWEPLLADPALVRTAVEETLRMDANSGFGMVRYLPVETRSRTPCCQGHHRAVQHGRGEQGRLRVRSRGRDRHRAQSQHAPEFRRRPAFLSRSGARPHRAAGGAGSAAAQAANTRARGRTRGAREARRPDRRGPYRSSSQVVSRFPVKFRLSVRARILSIALIPSVTLLAVGVGASTYLALRRSSCGTRSRADSATAPSHRVRQALQEERRLSLLVLSGDQSGEAGPHRGSRTLDKVMTSPELLEAQTTIAEVAPETVGGSVDEADEVIKAFTQVRQGVDAGLAPSNQVLLLYNTVLDRVSTATRGVANALPDADAVGSANLSVDLANAVESMSRGNALGVSAVNTMTATQLQDFTQQVGSYRNRIALVTPALPGEYRDRAEELVSSPAWQTLSSVENAIIERGVRPDEGPPLPVSVADWQAAAATVSSELADLYNDQYLSVIDGAINDAEDTATWWLVAGGAMLLGALAVGMVALRISARLIRRLKRLRAESLVPGRRAVAAPHGRLRNGEDVDVNTEIRPLDFGHDEIGDVADAFNRAESAAVSAAVEEARDPGRHQRAVPQHRPPQPDRRAPAAGAARQGRAQRGGPEPARGAVRARSPVHPGRRNAENLIILGGEQPGRQWRNPVPLVDVVRSAVAETEDYARVHTGHIAGVSIVGSVVADLIHLVAELVENATVVLPAGVPRRRHRQRGRQGRGRRDHRPGPRHDARADRHANHILRSHRLSASPTCPATHAWACWWSAGSPPATGSRSNCPNRTMAVSVRSSSFPRH